MTWRRLIELTTACRRPLVPVDFETAGLGGAPPVEYAVAWWADWSPQEQDPTSIYARGLAPVGLTYATHARVNPGCPIEPGAQRIHGITAADVKGAKSYKDMAIVATFRGLGAGDDDAKESPCIWVGHNIAEADLPWMRKWGYLPDDAPTHIDTIRLFRRLQKDHPLPLAPDALCVDDTVWRTLAGSVHCPAVGHGLGPYNATLAGMHTALFGSPADGGHGALSDVLASVRCLAAMLDLWAPLWPGPVVGEDPHAALGLLLKTLDEPPLDRVSWDGWLEADRDTKAITWARGKHKGKPSTYDRSYGEWVCGLPSAPIAEDGPGWCSDGTRIILRSPDGGRQGTLV